jgi:hypothetical protein
MKVPVGLRPARASERGHGTAGVTNGDHAELVVNKGADVDVSTVPVNYVTEE